MFLKDLGARSNNHTVGHPVKKDPAIAIMMAGVALQAKRLETARWLFIAMADKKIHIN
jgi:hypothetical protein